MSLYRCVNVLQCQLFPRRCVALERFQNVYPHVPATSYAPPPRAQPRLYVRLPPVPLRGKGREWALGRTVTAPLIEAVFRKSDSGKRRGFRPDSHRRCIGDPGGQPGWPLAGRATDSYSRLGLLSYRLGRQGRGGGIAGEASRAAPLPPRRPPPRPDHQLFWRAAVACLFLRRPDRGGGLLG